MAKRRVIREGVAGFPPVALAALAQSVISKGEPTSLNKLRRHWREDTYALREWTAVNIRWKGGIPVVDNRLRLSGRGWSILLDASGANVLTFTGSPLVIQDSLVALKMSV